jgi:predicted nucleic acid-binding protein
MNGKLILLDTNIVLYLLGDKYQPNNIPDGRYCISFISELELLSYPSLGKKDETIIRKFLNSIDIIEMNEEIKEKTILLLKKYHLKLPDAIICATAYSEKAVLFTNDKKLTKIKELKKI